MGSEQYLPWPANKIAVKEHLQEINDFPDFDEDTIKSNVKEPIEQMIRKTTLPIDSTQANWFDVYSIYNANQQLNEACNKLWAGIELINATRPDIDYKPLGTKFDGTFIFGTIIPTIYYSQLSAIIANLSIFGFVPLMLDRTGYFMIRTQDGWRIISRREYAQNQLKITTRSEHEIILKTFANLRDKNQIELSPVDLEKTFRLKKLRNEMDYEILGDLKMWRAYDRRELFYHMIPFVIDSISMSINTVKSIKRLITNCDERFEDLAQNFHGLGFFITSGLY